MSEYPKEDWLSRLLGGAFVTIMRLAAFVVRLFRKPHWDRKD